MGARVLISLDDALSGVTSLGLDTSPFIYLIERRPRYKHVVHDVFRRIDAGVIEGVSSVVTLTEVLTKPKQAANRTMEREYEDLLLHSEHVTLLAIDAEIAERAADLRARWQLRTPDALQIATAMRHGCQAFLTHDLRLRRVTDLQILVLEDLEL